MYSSLVPGSVAVLASKAYSTSSASLAWLQSRIGKPYSNLYFLKCKMCELRTESSHNIASYY